MAVAYAGAGATFTAKATTASFTISTGAASAGDLVLLRVGARFASTTASTQTLSDTGGNTWQLLGSSTIASQSHVYVYAALMNAAGTFTITVNFGTSPTVVAAATDRFSGVQLISDGGNAGGTASGSATISVASFSTAAAGDLLIASAALAQTGQTLTGQPTGWQALPTASTAGGGSSSNVDITGGYLAGQAAAGSVAWSASISPNTAVYSSYANSLLATVPAASPRLLSTNAAVMRAANF